MQEGAKLVHAKRVDGKIDPSSLVSSALLSVVLHVRRLASQIGSQAAWMIPFLRRHPYLLRRPNAWTS